MPPSALIIRFTAQNNTGMSARYPERNFGGNQLLDGSSTRVSSGFALLRHSSPSFGSQRNCSGSGLESTIPCRPKLLVFKLAFTLPTGLHPLTRTRARLLGPCFKTGRIASSLRRPHI